MDKAIPNAASAGAAPLIELRQALLRPDSGKLFQPINWTIHNGEHWALVGPTGSGKSLLVDTILKKNPLTGGRILYHFDPIPGAGEPGRPFFNRNDIIHVATSGAGLARDQSSGFHQARWHSMMELESPVVADYLCPETIHRISPFEVIDAAVPHLPEFPEMDPVISLMDIRHLLTRRVQHLSHGELRKVMIARALIQRPKLLILDDPFAGLDTRSRKMFRRTLENLLASGGIHILLVTARTEDIPGGVTHILRMDDVRLPAQNRKSRLVASTGNQTGADENALPEPRPEFFDPPPCNLPEGSDAPVIIDIKNTCVVYNGVTILDHIHWQVRQGERWAILGPNGAGKSTLLSLILADNPQAYANDITLFGRKRGTGESIWEIKRPVGWMSPELQIYYKKDATCLDVVCSGFFDSIGLYIACRPRQIEVARGWMDVLGIAGIENHLFARISEGRQRIALLARALVKSPRLLVLDEPCQGLDRSTRERTIRLIGQVCRRMNAALLYVTHDTDELPGVITHILALDAGKIAGCGLRKAGPARE